MNKENNSISRRVMHLPLWLDRLSGRVARWPWWIIIIAVGLVAAFYSIANSYLLRDALDWELGRPRLTTQRLASVVYDVKDTSGNTQRISGTLLADDKDNLTIETQAEIKTIIPRGEIGKLTCEAPDSNCILNHMVTVERTTVSGKLLSELVGNFQLLLSNGELLTIFKRDVATEQDSKTLKVRRIPDTCHPDLNGQACTIELTLKPDSDAGHIAGILTENTPQQITVQVKPQVIVKVAKADIIQSVGDVKPLQCALNNFWACNAGIFLTLQITFLAFGFALLIGLIFGLLRVSTNLVLYNLATVYVEVGRGLPIVVVLLFVNFAFAPWFRDNFPGAVSGVIVVVIASATLLSLYITVRRLPQWRLEPASIIQPIIMISISAVVLVLLAKFFEIHNELIGIPSAIIGLDFVYGAYLAELFRAGIQSIGRGQMEAARSLGMNYIEAMRYIILPQAFRVVLPPIGNDFISMLKDTSLIAFLAIPELTQQANQFAGEKFQPFAAFFVVSVLYLCMTLFLSFLVRTLERRMSVGR